MNPNTLLSLAAVLGVATLANAQIPAPTLPFQRTFDLLVFDSTSVGSPPTISDNIYRLSDFNQDGDYYDPGETLLYYDDLANGDRLNTVSGMACSETGTAYACDSSSDVVLSLRDMNYDGDANDPGESIVFFDSATNASGIQMLSAQGIVVDKQGRVFVLAANSGTPSIGDVIIKLEDLDGDGTANNQPGEASYYFQVPSSVSPINYSNPTGAFAIGPDGALYYGDIGSTVTKGVYRVFDADNNGTIDPTEFSLWWVPPYTSAAWYGMAFDPIGYVYVANHGGGAAPAKSIYRAFDANFSGAIDPGLPEEEQVFNYPTGSVTWWGMLRQDDGSFLLLDGILDGIYRLKDLNFDNNFNGPGEFTTVFDDTSVGLTLDLRAMTILRAPLIEMSPPVIQIGGTTNFVVRTTKPFDITVTGASLSLIAPFSLPPYGYLEIDPSSLIIFGTGLSDAQGVFSSPLTFNNDPSLIGTYGCTSLSGDFYRLFLSNGAPLTVTP